MTFEYSKTKSHDNFVSYGNTSESLGGKGNRSMKLKYITKYKVTG